MKQLLWVNVLAALAAVGCGSDSPPASGAAGSSADAGALSEAGTSSGSAGAGGAGGNTSQPEGGEAGDASAGASTSGAGGSGAGAGGSSASAGMGGGSAGSGVTDPGTEGDGDLTIGPTFTDSPDVLVKASVPHGTLFKFTMNSTASKIYTGLDKTLLAANQHSFTREINVYIPKQYVDGTAAPILFGQDGLQTDMVNALDNLIADKRLPAIVTVFVANGGGDSKGSERGLEYDTVSDRYARFIQTEVLPAVLAVPAIKTAYPKLAFTSDPDGRGTYGCSSGGEAAFSAAWFHPEWFHRIITYSGTFVDLQDDDAPEEKTYPLGSWEYHSNLIPGNPAKPLRVFLAVSQMDNHYMDAESTHFNWLLANQHMAAALKAKNYHYRFVYAKGAGHCDAKVRRATLPDTLRWMWRGYPIQ